jgi:hypothetical protein
MFIIPQNYIELKLNEFDKLFSFVILKMLLFCGLAHEMAAFFYIQEVKLLINLRG